MFPGNTVLECCISKTYKLKISYIRGQYQIDMGTFKELQKPIQQTISMPLLPILSVDRHFSVYDHEIMKNSLLSKKFIFYKFIICLKNAGNNKRIGDLSLKYTLKDCVNPVSFPQKKISEQAAVIGEKCTADAKLDELVKQAHLLARQVKKLLKEVRVVQNIQQNNFKAVPNVSSFTFNISSHVR